LPGEIPVIAIGALRDRSASAAVAAAIGAACRQTGFFYVSDHGVPEVLLGDLRAQAEAFFALPEAAKNHVSIEHSQHNRGYVPFEAEKLDPSRKGDLKEGFNMGRELAADDPDLVAGRPFCGPNQWPSAMPAFQAAMCAYFDAMLALCQDLHRAFALDLGMPETFFEKLIDKPLATLRLLHYPPHPGTFVPDQYGAAPHVRLQYRRLPDALVERRLRLDAPSRGQSLGPPALVGAVFPRPQRRCARRVPAELQGAGTAAALSAHNRGCLFARTARRDLRVSPVLAGFAAWQRRTNAFTLRQACSMQGIQAKRRKTGDDRDTRRKTQTSSGRRTARHLAGRRRRPRDRRLEPQRLARARREAVVAGRRHV